MEVLATERIISSETEIVHAQAGSVEMPSSPPPEGYAPREVFASESIVRGATAPVGSSYYASSVNYAGMFIRVCLAVANFCRLQSIQASFLGGTCALLALSSLESSSWSEV